VILAIASFWHNTSAWQTDGGASRVTDMYETANNYVALELYSYANAKLDAL